MTAALVIGYLVTTALVIVAARQAGYRKGLEHHHRQEALAESKKTLEASLAERTLRLVPPSYGKIPRQISRQMPPEDSRRTSQPYPAPKKGPTRP